MFRDLLVDATLGVPSWTNPCDLAQAVPATLARFVHERPAYDWSPIASPRAAAVPAAWPMTKQAPETRAADCPRCVIEAQRPAINKLSTPSGTSMR